jgi:hypothetical protein
MLADQFVGEAFVLSGKVQQLRPPFRVGFERAIVLR